MKTIYSTEKARESQKELKKKLKKRLPKWKKEGSRDEWIKNIHMIINQNWSLLKYKINKRDKFKCQECGIDLQDINNTLIEWETHHIIPVSKGGSFHPNNLITLCKSCHRKHTNHLLKNKSAYHKNQRKIFDNR